MTVFLLMQVEPIVMAASVMSLAAVVLLIVGIRAIVTKRMPETAKQQLGSMVLHGKRKTETTGKQAVMLGWAFVGLSVFASLIAASVWYKYLTQDPQPASQQKSKYLDEQSFNRPGRLDGMRQRLDRQNRGFQQGNGINSNQ